MRWYILRTLLHKEMLRHLADRGGLALAGLLVALSLLLSLGRANQQSGTLVGDIGRVYIIYYPDDPGLEDVQRWYDVLRQQAPEDLRRMIRFRSAHEFNTTPDGRIVFSEHCGAIMLRSTGESAANRGYQVTFWYPGQDSTVLAPVEAWFWRVTQRHFHALPRIEEERTRIEGSADTRSMLASALVLIALFFSCVYLLPSLMCEERERGVLLAQALSPASPLEILAAKFLFYPVLGMALGSVLGGIYNPSVLLKPFFWGALTATAIGSLGIGMCVASVARTQRQASMGALCYMLVVSLFMFICQQNGIPFLPSLALEYHAPKMLHAALANNIQFGSYLNLAGASFLAIVWASLAVFLFRRGGWQ